MKIQYYCGVDISSETLDICVLKEGKVILALQIENNRKGILKLIKKVRKMQIPDDQIVFCAEHTGNYGNDLMMVLEQQSLIYCMISAIEIKRSLGLTRGKTDKVDAFRIAQYAMRFSDKLRPSKIPEKELIGLRQLYNYRKNLIKRKVQADNRIKKLSREFPCAPRDFIIKEVKSDLAKTLRKIKAVECKIDELIKSNEHIQKSYKLITSVPGVGPITAVYLLLSTQNFTLFENARKFASYAGVAPYENSSGKSLNGRNRTSPFRNREVKTLMYNGVNAIILRNNEFSDFYNRKIQEGKNNQLVKNAVLFKVITRVFCVVKRQTPYIQIDKYKNAA